MTSSLRTLARVLSAWAADVAVLAGPAPAVPASRVAMRPAANPNEAKVRNVRRSILAPNTTPGQAALSLGSIALGTFDALEANSTSVRERVGAGCARRIAFEKSAASDCPGGSHALDSPPRSERGPWRRHLVIA